MFTIAAFWACVLLPTGEPVCHGYDMTGDTDTVMVEHDSCVYAGHLSGNLFAGIVVRYTGADPSGAVYGFTCQESVKT